MYPVFLASGTRKNFPRNLVQGVAVITHVPVFCTHREPGLNNPGESLGSLLS